MTEEVFLPAIWIVHRLLGIATKPGFGSDCALLFIIPSAAG